MNKCNICPHNCNVDRKKQKGRCRATDKVKIALASLHFYEEPCISGQNGSGTVFFSHCNLSCVYCQNYKISQQDFGKEVSIKQLAKIFLSQQQKGANNINLVTPTMYVEHIIAAIIIALQCLNACRNNSPIDISLSLLSFIPMLLIFVFF